ncbi:MAG: Sensor histidine kinase YehU [Bacteroidetes bacterium ADurb.Bin408]|nr:MAG: Sensor histidine kinase YehU [Bacteroidetes bacterium ADurb.Bin408]
MNEELFKESQRQLADIQHLYENEKMNNEMRYLKQMKEVQDLRLERNRLLIYASFTGVALLIFILSLIYRANRLKTKANEKLKLQNVIIEKQKQEIESEKQRADSQILEILKANSNRLQEETSGATIDDYRMVAALFKKMENENLHSKIELLKNEVNPHFLFNSLNNLVSLIEENQAVAANYVQELSSVYLYVLRSKEKELVELVDEINFARSYSFLLFRRFGNNLIFNMHIDEAHHKLYVPPLCMELLIENAVKHNIVTAAKPLTIEIYVENNYLVVRNNLQPKNTAVTSTKVGLKNIEKRYALLCEKKIEIIKTKKEFIVKLPLIDLT